MPELPEVETIVNDLRGELTGRRFESIWLSKIGVLRHPDPANFKKTLSERVITGVNRRGKFIVVKLDSGDDLVVHLGMTGHLQIVAPEKTPPKHTHFRAQLDDGRELRLDDARRFGRMVLGPWEYLEKIKALPKLGPEPFFESTDGVDEIFGRSTRVLKTFLLDQGSIAGIGNIYADEICFLSGVKPTRRVHQLTRKEKEKLIANIPLVLRKAIANRGTTFDDYRDIWDGKGKNQEQLLVYGRGGEPCFNCESKLRSVVIGGRTTVYCSRCQH